MSDKFFKKFDESSKLYESLNEKIGPDFPTFESFSRVYEQNYDALAQKMYKKSYMELTPAQKADVRRYSTADAIDQMQDTASIEQKISQMEKKAHYHGTNIFERVFQTTPLDIDIKPIRAEFYDNMVTLNKGMKPEGKDAIIDAISQVAANLKQVNGYKPESTVITITGTANNKAATTAAGGPETELDHRGEPYGGGEPNNEYLARERAISVRDAIKDQFDEGVEFRIKSFVTPGEKEEDKYIYVTAESKGEVKDVVTVGKIKLGLSSNLQIKTGAELAQSEGFPTPSGETANEKFFYGRRTITIVPANGVQKQFTLIWDGQGPVFNTGNANMPQKRIGGWKSAKADGTSGSEGMTSGQAGPNLGNARESIAEALKTSGVFSAQEASTIINKFVDGNDEFFNKPENMNIPVSEDGWKKFVTTIGLGTQIPEPNAQLAEENGAMIIDRTKTPPEIINPIA